MQCASLFVAAGAGDAAVENSRKNGARQSDLG